MPPILSDSRLTIKLWCYFRSNTSTVWVLAWGRTSLLLVTTVTYHALKSPCFQNREIGFCQFANQTAYCYRTDWFLPEVFISVPFFCHSKLWWSQLYAPKHPLMSMTHLAYQPRLTPADDHGNTKGLKFFPFIALTCDLSYCRLLTKLYGYRFCSGPFTRYRNNAAHLTVCLALRTLLKVLI